MAITISLQPNANKIVSTLLPIHFKLLEMTANTTNIIARCFQIDQTSAVETQVGADYRCAPLLEFPDIFNFDASEILNTLTKYTLNDMPNSIKLGGNNSVWTDGQQDWEDVAGFKIIVRFYREYLDGVTGLIVVDWASPEDSNEFYVHEGCPEVAWLNSNVSSNGLSGSVFDSFQFNWEGTSNQIKRWLTNYPISFSGGARIDSQVTIHESESYLLAWFSPDNSPYCGYLLHLTTYADGVLLNTHTAIISESRNLQTAMVGFRDIVAGLTPNGGEGTDFENVTSYYVKMKSGTTTGAGCVQEQNSTRYKFIVDRSCLPKGYMRFCFKNILGGYDMVSSKGSFIKRKKSKFIDFEQSLGYDRWNQNSMEFGKSNWANQNTTRYSVVTHAVKKEYAEHWAELFQSTQVYMRVVNDSHEKVYNTNYNTNAERQPYFYKGIQIENGSSQIIKSIKNTYKFKFNFTLAIPQRTPRY